MTPNGIAGRLGASREVLVLSAARLADGIGNSILIVVIPLYVAQLPAPWFPFPQPVRVGLLISLYGLINTAVQPLAGTASDRWGHRKPFVVGGLLLMGLAILAYLIVGRYAGLLAFRAVQGVGLGLTLPATMALMTTYTDRATRGGAMGIFSTSRIVGFSLGPLIGGFLQTHFGFAAAFWVAAGAVLGAVVLVQIFVREPAVTGGRAARRFHIFDRSLFSRDLLSLAFGVLVMAASFSMMVTLEEQFNERLGQSALGFGFAFSALMITRLILQIPLGSLSDRIGRKPLIVAGLALLAPATALLGIARTTAGLAAYRALQGVATAGVAAPTFALAADLSSPGAEGRQLAVVTMSFGLGLALGPLVAGFLALPFFELPFLIGAVLALAAAFGVWRGVSEPSRA